METGRMEFCGLVTRSVGCGNSPRFMSGVLSEYQTRYSPSSVRTLCSVYCSGFLMCSLRRHRNYDMQTRSTKCRRKTRQNQLSFKAVTINKVAKRADELACQRERAERWAAVFSEKPG